MWRVCAWLTRAECDSSSDTRNKVKDINVQSVRKVLFIFKYHSSMAFQGLLPFLLCFLVRDVYCSMKSLPPDHKAIRLDGDIILGGLFPMHEKGTLGRICGAIKEEKGIQRVEAMLYAIDKINRDPFLLPNITLGVHILDTCLRDTYALEQSLEFIKAHMSTLDFNEYRCESGEIPRQTTYKPVAGVIGAAASPVSIMVANILRLFQIPQISYASTGIELSDKSRFGYFTRVVPPDTLQAQALVDVVKAFGWSYVSTVADEGNYGEKGIAAFEKIAVDSGICIAKREKIPREIKANTFSNIITNLLVSSKAKVVVLFVNEDNCRRLINETIFMRHTNSFYWLASDSWGAKQTPVEDQEFAAEGAVTILPQRKLLKGFDNYFTRLNPKNNKRNPWFEEFWESHFKCTFSLPSKLTPRCSDTLRITHETYEQEGIVPFVVDAVYAMAHALHNMLTAECRTRRLRRCKLLGHPEGELILSYIRNVSFFGQESLSSDPSYKQEGLVPFVVDAVYAMALAIKSLHLEKCWYSRGMCREMLPVAGPQLLKHIRKVSFIGHSGKVKFNENGDAMGRYTIYQYQRQLNGRYDYVPIGNWSDRFVLDRERTIWKHRDVTPPRSVCSEPCEPGYVMKNEADSCCWICVKCVEYEILVDIHTCEACPNGSYPDADKRECIRLPIEYMTLASPWAIVPVVVAAFGIMLTLFIVVVFVRFNSTPVIMASGRELCYVLMMGLLLSYGMTFIMVARPTLVTCTILRLGLGLSLSMCYAAMFTKTNRISRIFNRGVKAMVKRPSYTSPKSQLVICACLVSVQIIGAITWIGMELPGTTLLYPDRTSVVLSCRSTNFSVVLSLLYNMVLIIMCTVYAFKTRKIPENFNEAKYIAFTMYSTCIVWLAFIPIYFGTNKSDFRVQITALCMCVSISATVTLGCMFVPKVYIVLFQPHKNVRAGSKGALGAGGRAFFGRQSSGIMGAMSMNGGVTSPTGLALLIAQGTKNREREKGTGSQSQGVTSDSDKCESLKDLDSSCQDNSDPETNV